MEQGEAAARFYGVAYGVAQIQQCPLAPVKFITTDHVPLHANTHGDHPLELLPHRGFLQLPEKILAVKHGVFDDLGAPGPVFPLWQRIQQGRVAQHQRGLIEAAGGLAPHGGIHHGQQRGGYLNIGNSPLIGGGGEACQIPHHAAAQRHEEIAAGEAAVAEEIQNLSVGGKIFLLFPVREQEMINLKSGIRQSFFGGSAVKGEHRVIRDHGGPAAKAQLRCHGPQPGQQTRLNDNVILAGGRDMDGGQRPSTSSFRFRPSSSRRTRPGRSLCTMAS